MNETIRRFIELGNACPDCGKNPVLTKFSSLINKREQAVLSNETVLDAV